MPSNAPARNVALFYRLAGIHFRLVRYVAQRFVPKCLFVWLGLSILFSLSLLKLAQCFILPLTLMLEYKILFVQ